ncbi:DUF2332 domain-containing protein [Geodermatophilus sp. TF02-6]|uniref:DUF2332 domain-containing protein n=1 Tax=Geodermatophilus sp. TF02-6 TaxID=2250575 RepID=UPI000DEA216B|nr:DUF2332 domain-containing protein [Geodermatophilus sp. TF02-6]RBY82114.1 DUF2332 domain-containing protein [Geodermatophilus sp. TF02-6]
MSEQAPAVADTDGIERIAAGYRRFAEVEAATASPLYARLAIAVAEDEELLRFLSGLPTGKRQPNLLFAAVRYLHGTPAGPAELRGAVLEEPDRLRATVLARATQTNEAARCTALLPFLGLIEGPLALIEVGASAGLCLYPDRYSYDYDGRPVGPPSPVHLTCTTTGAVPVPAALPEVTARIGIDLDPLDPADDADRAWLQALIWPGSAAEERRARLDAAATIAAREPVRMLAGHLLDRLPEAVGLVSTGSSAVVFHTALLPYVPLAQRKAFVELVRELPVRWIAQEGPGALPEVEAQLPDADEARGRFVLSLDGRPVAWTAPHGGRIDWFAGGWETIGR